MGEKHVKNKETVTSLICSPPLAARSRPHPLDRYLDTIFDQFRRSFDDLIAPVLPIAPLTPTILAEMQVRHPAVDLVDNGDHYTITAELPGSTKDSVDIQVNKDELQIKAQKKVETEEKKKNYIHRERTYSTFEKTLTFPEEIIPTKCEGEIKDGVLELRIQKRKPKPEEKMTKVKLK